jgi:predicted regulator of Ras-like GTPase activity (Roadblock/LC7/MglB family)
MTVDREQIKTILGEIRRQSAAQAALLLSGDGVVLESVGDAHADLDTLAAYAASSVMVCERLGESASFGSPEAVMVVFPARAVAMAPLGPAMAVLIGSASQLGALRLTLLRFLDDLGAALRGERPRNLQASEAGDAPPADRTKARVTPGLG